MASASSKVGGLTFAVHLLAPLALGSAGYAAWRVNWPMLTRSFLTGPGRTSRLLLLLFVVFNWKNLPFAWTVSCVDCKTSLRNPLRKTVVIRHCLGC